MDVVIGVRVMLCHQVIDNSGFSTFLNFPLRVPILILLSCCINSSSLFLVAILCTLLHCENESFEVWYLHEVLGTTQGIPKPNQVSTRETGLVHPSTPKIKQVLDQNVDLSNVDQVPSNAHLSEKESQLYIFEDNEAVIKMIIKRRSRTMRHVSRTF